MEPQAPTHLSRRRVLGLVGIGVGLGGLVSAGIVLTRDDDDDAADQPLGVPVVAPGVTVDGAAIWLFGFDTLRVDPVDLGDAGRLGASAVGDPIGAVGIVYLVSGSTGRVERIDATTNSLRVGPTIEVALPDGVLSGVTTADGVWVTTAPATVAVLETATLAEGVSLPLDVAGAVQTWLVADGDAVVAATVGADGVVLHRFADPASPPTRTDLAGMGADAAVVAVTAGDARGWVVLGDRAQAFDLTSLATGTVRALDPDDAAAGPVLAAASVGDDLWVLSGDGATALRAPRSEGEPWTRVALLDTPTSGVHTPAALLSAHDALYALVQTSDDADRPDSLLVRVDPEADRVTATLDLPGDLLIAALAAS